jgi:protein-S-isoprenylcysteine O-methyltransferase Ste14
MAARAHDVGRRQGIREHHPVFVVPPAWPPSYVARVARVEPGECGTMRSAWLHATRVAGFIATLWIWQQVQRAEIPLLAAHAVIIGSIVLVFPVSWLGRKAIDGRATLQRVAWTTSLVHMALMIFFGAAFIAAIKLFHDRPGPTIPIPTSVGLAFLSVTGVCLTLTVVNLALGGLGAPFAIAPSRRVATSWMYRWTRNPMVLCTLLTLLSAGVYLRSLGFLLWVILLVTPAFVYYLKVFEERELEIRLGQSYVDYRATTAFLWPRRPRSR